MKKIFSVGKIFQTIITLTLLIFLALRCQDTASKKKEPEAATPTAVNQDSSLIGRFRQNPPIVQQLFIQKLKVPDANGNNFIVIAQFPESERSMTRLSQVEVKMDSSASVFFSDNGDKGDEKKADKLFTAAIKMNESDLLTLLNSNNDLIRRKQNVETIFIGRSAISRKIQTLDLVKLRAGERVALDIPFSSVINATNIVSIREKSLMVRNLSVVEDLSRTYDPCRSPNKGNPGGAWSFNTLITNMANGQVDVKQFLIDWVDKFLFSKHTLPSSDATTDRLPSKERFIKAWMQNSGLMVPTAAGVPNGWQQSALKAQDFPVRLLAIVNRVDLRDNIGYGGNSRTSGEGRFVFCFADSRANCSGGNNADGTMTFIFEYAVPVSGCNARVQYAKKWWDLQNMQFGNAFNAQLEAITRVFTSANAMPSRTNGSALNHLRTNDFLPTPIQFTVNPWDIREFELDANTNKLKITHPNKEPMESSNGFPLTIPSNAAKQAALVAFVNALPFSFPENPAYEIPAALEATHAPMRVVPTTKYHWRGPNANIMIPVQRRGFSLNACSGCHKGETKNDFTHVRPRSAGSMSVLSGFMTGTGADDNPDTDTDPLGKFFVTDPSPITPLTDQKAFNEAHRRAIDLERLAFGSFCSIRPGGPRDLITIHSILTTPPLNMTH